MGYLRNLAGKPIGASKVPPKSLSENMMYEVEWLNHSVYEHKKPQENEFQAYVEQEDHCMTIANGMEIAQSILHSKHESLQLVTSSVLSSTSITPLAENHSINHAGLAGLSRSMAQEASRMDIFVTENKTITADRAASIFSTSTNDFGDPCFSSMIDSGSVKLSTIMESRNKASRGPFRLFPHPRGALNNLKPEEIKTSISGGNDILLDVKAVGINFRDVLNVLGMYPGDPGAPGGDCSGVVVDCGRDVSSLRPGDPVFGLAGGSLGSHVHVAASRMAPMPPNLSFEAAATCPTVFITVDAAFRQAAGCLPGERVLVHAAAGGVGLAAIQMAAALGGLVVATAGSPNKRALVRSMGVAQAVGSRDTQFVSDIAQLGGVDIVLNSLTSSGMVSGSLSVLRHGGRFIEISKRDIWSGFRVSQERPDVGYTLVAVDFLPDMAVQQALQRLGSRLSHGVVCPLPQVTHRLSDVQAALRQMSQARHVGKIVASTFAASLPHCNEQNGRMLVTGGLGTLGSLTASWLASEARCGVIATGRTGRLRGPTDLSHPVSYTHLRAHET